MMCEGSIFERVLEEVIKKRFCAATWSLNYCQLELLGFYICRYERGMVRMILVVNGRCVESQVGGTQTNR
jgi:hypothetical protein